jgi:hypothetical protein
VIPNGRTWTAAILLLMTGLARAWVAFAVVAGVAAAWWLMRLRRHPRGPCRWCRNRRGRNPGSEEEQWGWCSHCNHTGERLRFGARWINSKLR